MRKLVVAVMGVGSLALFAGVAPARALTIDPTRSSLTPSAGAAQPLSGSVGILLGASPPLSSNTTFDVTSLDAHASGGLAIGLDPALAHPGAGVLSPSGSFLVPNLFLRLVDGASTFDLTVPNVLGSYGAFAGCPADVCLQTSFDVDTGGPSGVVHVELYAIPEPETAGLLALGLAALAAARRRTTRGSR
jgi:PEP-CTERM motif-containing protein